MIKEVKAMSQYNEVLESYGERTQIVNKLIASWMNMFKHIYLYALLKIFVHNSVINMQYKTMKSEQIYENVFAHKKL